MLDRHLAIWLAPTPARRIRVGWGAQSPYQRSRHTSRRRRDDSSPSLDSSPPRLRLVCVCQQSFFLSFFPTPSLKRRRTNKTGPWARDKANELRWPRYLLIRAPSRSQQNNNLDRTGSKSAITHLRLIRLFYSLLCRPAPSPTSLLAKTFCGQLELGRALRSPLTPFWFSSCL